MGALDLGGSIPTIGGATFLLAIIGVLTRLWLGAEHRHLAELTRVNRMHDDELDEKRTEIAGLRQRNDELTKLVDAERQRRWRAEDHADIARRPQLGGEPHAQ